MAVMSGSSGLAALKAIGRSYARFGFENPSEYKLLFMTDSAYMEALFAEMKTEPGDPGERAFQFLVDTVIGFHEAGAIAQLRGEGLTLIGVEVRYHDARTGLVEHDPARTGALKASAQTRPQDEHRVIRPRSCARSRPASTWRALPSRAPQTRPASARSGEVAVHRGWAAQGGA